jgi:hypothetical protein
MPKREARKRKIRELMRSGHHAKMGRPERPARGGIDL